mgnify:CR=1 FL=1
MNLFKQNILSYLKSKRLNVFLLFVVLAFLFSVLSKLSKEYTHSFTFKINAINVPEEHVILNDSTNAMTIDLTTYGFKHIKYYLTQPEIDVDFSNLSKTPSHYKWIEANELSKIINQFDANIEVKNITPDTISFKYDVNSVKMVPVKLVSNIKFFAGYDVVGDYGLEPDSVKVIGPKSVVEAIIDIKTKPLNLENVNSNIDQAIELNLPNNSEDIKISKGTVRVNGNVEKFTEGTIDVPVSVINTPENVKINFYPKIVPVVFYTSLSDFKSISSSSFLVQCDFKDIKENSTYLIPRIAKQPETIKSAKLNVKQIEFIIVK